MVIFLGMCAFIASGYTLAAGCSCQVKASASALRSEKLTGTSHPVFWLKYGDTISDIMSDLMKIISEDPPYKYMLLYDKNGCLYGYYLNEDIFINRLAVISNKESRIMLDPKSNKLFTTDDKGQSVLVMDLSALEKDWDAEDKIMAEVNKKA